VTLTDEQLAEIDPAVAEARIDRAEREHAFGTLAGFARILLAEVRRLRAEATAARRRAFRTAAAVCDAQAEVSRQLATTFPEGSAERRGVEGAAGAALMLSERIGALATRCAP
jgi:hypothetical protein